MTDISGTGDDIRLFDSQVPKASNILSVQLGSLEYAQDLGVDLDYFLSKNFEFQNQSFNNYLVEVLTRNGINVASMKQVIHNLFEELKFEIKPEETSTALVR